MIDNLKAFAAVIDCKSLTKAASRLFLTQSAISRRIQQLEEALGGTLLDRTQRPPSSTALGQRVYEQSLPILRAVDDLMTLTRQDAAPTGTLRFGMSQAIGDVIMADAVEQLSGEFPTLDVRVRAGWGASLSDQVNAGDLDAAIVMLQAGTRPAAPLIGRTIATVDMAIVQSRRRPRVRKAVALADLAKQDWILNPIGCGYRAGLESAMGRERPPSARRGRHLRHGGATAHDRVRPGTWPGAAQRAAGQRQPRRNRDRGCNRFRHAARYLADPSQGARQSGARD